MLNVVITGTGSYIPGNIVSNKTFEERDFYDKGEQRIDQPGAEITEKFKAITGIEERRYANTDQKTSDIASIAAERAIQDAGIDRETIDQIIVAQNFGDIVHGTIQTDIVPSIAARVKHALKVENPACIAFDIQFGCPGWVQGVIMANSFIKSGAAKRIMVIGAETLSRVVDPHDRDSMIYSDGAGATIIEGVEGEKHRGIMAYNSASYTLDEAYYLRMGPSYKPESDTKVRFIKMDGRKIYNFALANVPGALKECLEKAGLGIRDVKKILLHQANAKMDHAIVSRLYQLYAVPEPQGIMPMSIHNLGNSSVATVPTLLDMVLKGKQEGHALQAGDIVLFASVGAGMNINAIAYRM